MFCPKCDYELPACECRDPFFHKHAEELRYARENSLKEAVMSIANYLEAHPDKFKGWSTERTLRYFLYAWRPMYEQIKTPCESEAKSQNERDITNK